MDLKVFKFAITLAFYPGCGWMPIGTKMGQEVYRGEYRATPEEALVKAKIWLEEQEG